MGMIRSRFSFASCFFSYGCGVACATWVGLSLEGSSGNSPWRSIAWQNCKNLQDEMSYSFCRVRLAKSKRHENGLNIMAPRVRIRSGRGRSRIHHVIVGPVA
jgi:hypothetical protein